jgi:hypothetical protein
MEKPLKNIDDAYTWSIGTVDALRSGDFSKIDMDELINEIGSIASGLRRQLISALRQSIESLLVAEYTTNADRRNEMLLVEAQGKIQVLLSSAPGLRAILDEAIEEAYPEARQFVTDDYQVALPDRCPLAVARITEHPYERLLAAEQQS